MKLFKGLFQVSRSSVNSEKDGKEPDTDEADTLISAIFSIFF